MLDELQRLVDGLAGRLTRAVAIDDVGLRLLVYSAHEVAVDPVRAQIILERRAPAEPAAWVQSLGIRKSTGPMRIPPNNQLGIWSRLCIPIRCQGIHFGYLWLIDPDQSLADWEVTAAAAAADEAGLLLYRERVLSERTGARHRELLSDLLGDDEHMRSAAAAMLTDRQAFVAEEAVRAMVAKVPDHERLDDARRLGVAHAVDRLTGAMPAGHALSLVRASHSVLLVTATGLARAPDLPERLYRSYQELDGIDAKAVTVAVGTLEPTVGRAVESYRRALQALRVANVVTGFRPIAVWDDLGIYTMLVDLSLEQLNGQAIHPGVRRLQEHPASLLATLELFLDHAGDTKAVSERLGIHRASVYQRLRRVEEITGLDLANGEQRLAAHLSIKIRRLTAPGASE